MKTPTIRQPASAPEMYLAHVIEVKRRLKLIEQHLVTKPASELTYGDVGSLVEAERYLGLACHWMNVPEFQGEV